MSKRWLTAMAVFVMLFAVGASVQAAQINGNFDPNSTDTELAEDVEGNWDGQDFDCERSGSTVQAFWDGLPAGQRALFDDDNGCLGRSVYLTFVADNPAMPAHPYELILECDATSELLMSAQFGLDGNTPQFLTDGRNDFGDVSILAMGLTTDSAGFAAGVAPATTPRGTVIALVAAALVLGAVVLRRLV